MPIPMLIAGGAALAGAGVNALSNYYANKQAQRGARDAANAAANAWNQVSGNYVANEKVLRD